MAERKKAGGGRPIQSYEHKDKKRANNPPVGLVTPDTDPDAGRTDQTYAHDPYLDPQLVWAGKAEHTSFAVPTVSLHVHERIDPLTIVEAVRRRGGDGGARQMSLFDTPEENPPLRQAVEFYRHAHGWSNRMVAGDSLLVMNSLLEKEGLAGKVQMIYIDPPYGIKYGSNFQPFVNKRDVKDGRDEDLTAEPEQIRAFRDTWELGVHSYLTYLRDRLLTARELLAESGSVFVQISDENVHHVREIMDEVFNHANFVSVISVRKTTSQGTAVLLGTTTDFILWYVRDRNCTKYRQLFIPRSDVADDRYDQAMLDDGSVVSASQAPPGASLLQIGDLTSSRPVGEGDVLEFVYCGRKHSPGKGTFKTNLEGLLRLGNAGRIQATSGNILRYRRFKDDFPLAAIGNLWYDISGAVQSRSDPKIYVVQSSTEIVARCLLMTTDPGDLVLDPTCGSGTTAFAAEQWGRRWITCDTSRVALALARTRLMTAVYDYYELAHPREGVGSGFVYRTVPHVTLKSIANNPEIDGIHARRLEELERARGRINTLLGEEQGEFKPLEEWEIPRERPAHWPPEADRLLGEWWELRRRLREEIDAAIARHAPQETLYDQPRVDRRKVRVSGPFTVEAVPAPAVMSVDELLPCPHPDPLPEGEGARRGPHPDPLPGGEGIRRGPHPDPLPEGEGARRGPHPGSLPGGEGIRRGPHPGSLPGGEGARRGPHPGSLPGGEGIRRGPHPDPLPEGEGARRGPHPGSLPGGEGELNPLPMGEGGRRPGEGAGIADRSSPRTPAQWFSCGRRPGEGGQSPSAEAGSDDRVGAGKTRLDPELLEFARKLRRELTDAERLLWALLRDRRLAGFKFRRQHPIDPYVLDFFCPEARLGIELDGGQHNESEAMARDEEREAFLSERGVRVIRFWNNVVLRETEAVLETIYHALTPTLSQRERGIDEALTQALSQGERGIDEALTPTLSQRERGIDEALTQALSQGERGIDEALTQALSQRERGIDEALTQALSQGERGDGADASIARSGETLRQGEWRDELLRTGIRAKGGQHIRFARLEPLPGCHWLHADGETRPAAEGADVVREDAPAYDPMRVVVSFGPEHAPLEQRQVEHAWEEARSLAPMPKLLIFAAFQFDPEAAKDIDEMRAELAGMQFLKVQMNADLLTDDLKKKRASNESFWLIGQPDVRLERVAPSPHPSRDGGGSEGERLQWRVIVEGFDYYNTKTGLIESGGAHQIAVWLLDTDYDGRTLYPRQVFFPMAGEKEGWARLAKNLRSEIDEELIEAYRGTVSLPFEPGGHRRIAVKIVDDRGIESLKVLELE